MIKIKHILYAFVSLILLLYSCYEETTIPVEAFFSNSFIGADQSVPVQIGITNLSQGADSYQWTFEGATPTSSTDENPGVIVYQTPGTYNIILVASNVDGQTHTFQKQVRIYDEIQLDFSVEVLESNYPPVEVAINNNTDGVGLTYQWTFEGGTPESTTEQHPNNVLFEQTGEHQIKLVVSNGFESFEDTKTITVLPDIEAGFDWAVNFEDDDMQAPVTIVLNNTSISATSYQWSFEEGAPATSTEENPIVTFNQPGTYTLTLLADNGKRTSTYEQQITVLPDTNLRTFTDIKFGINSAHNNNQIGAFFSSTTRESYTANEVTDENGSLIDIIFSGLNSSFTFNKFISPAIMQNNGFTPIPNAMHTKFINSQEICNCGGLSAEDFDAMTDDSFLASLIIEESAAGLQSFNQITLPRIVLFETPDGKKGAIKVKGFISDEENSYINTDIKIQKQP